MRSITGQVAIVTGGTKGIGRAIVDALAEEGCKIVCVARTAAEVESTVGELTARTGITWSDRVGWVMEYVGSQVGIFSPLLGLAVFAALIKGVREAWKRPGDDRVVLPVCMALPVFLYFLQQSFKSPVFGNWPGVAYIPAGMLAMSEIFP